jgi:rhamnosyltransferase
MNAAQDNQATITIALLTLNGGELLKRLLDAVQIQRTSRAIEYIAIDSGSTDDTLKNLEDAGFKTTSISANTFNFGSTRDQLYSLATHDYVINLSQDAVPAHNEWLENLVAPLDENNKVAVSSGRSIPDEQRAYPQFPWEKNGYFYFTREMQRFVQKHGKGVSFSNSAVRRNVWEGVRFQPIVLSEDFQFQIELGKGGWETAFPDEAEVLHHHDYTVEKLKQRCRDEGEAMRVLGSPYSFGDCMADWLHYRKNKQWLREIKYRRLNSKAAWLFPLLRPWAVYQGSRRAVRKE